MYNRKEDITDGYYELVDVTDRQELKKIKRMPELSGFTVNKVRRIQNWNLYRRYQIMKAEVIAAVQKYMPTATVERQLFHGTSSSKLTAICKSGFDRDYSGTAAGMSKSGII